MITEQNGILILLGTFVFHIIYFYCNDNTILWKICVFNPVKSEVKWVGVEFHLVGVEFHLVGVEFHLVGVEFHFFGVELHFFTVELHFKFLKKTIELHRRKCTN